MLDTLWIFLIIYIVIIGVYFSYKIKFKNYLLKDLTKRINKDNLFLSLGTKMGVGSLIGTTMSIYIGGAGSIFWIIVFSFITSSIIYVESTLGYKFKHKKDESISGIYFYTKYGLNNNKLAIIMMILFITTYSFFFLMIQSNTISSILNIKKSTLIIIFTIFIYLLITNKITEIRKILNKIVPCMCLFFLIISLFGIIKHLNTLPIVIKQIIIYSFNKKSFLTGMIIGIKRSIFLNELLIGTTSMSSGINEEQKDVVAHSLIIGSYFIVFIVSTLISLLILIYLNNNNTYHSSYINLLLSTFNYHFNIYGNYFLSLLICLLGTSSIISGIYIGKSNIRFFTNNKIIILIFNLLILLFTILGIILKINIIWKLIDIIMLLIIGLNGLIIIKLKDYI